MDCLSILPDEVILEILKNLTVDDILHCEVTCKRLNKAVDASLWRQKCMEDFKTWDERHDQQTRLVGPLHAVDWRSCYQKRRKIDRKAQTALNGMIEHQYGRLDQLDSIAHYEDDIVDTMRANIATPRDTPDVLARRWHARNVYGHIQRTKAIKIWSAMANRQPIALTNALLCFDRFILCDKALDYGEACQIFDRIARSVRTEISDWAELTTREKASTIAKFLLDQDLVGLKDSHRYHDVRNSLLSVALTHEEHPSLPLISTVIFCEVAERLGLQAEPCPLPLHVYAVVYAEVGFDIDGNQTSSQSSNDSARCFLDPFASFSTKSATQLFEALKASNIYVRGPEDLTTSTADSNMVTRTARNIIRAVKDIHGDGQINGFPLFDPETALYASMWSLFLLSMDEAEHSYDTLNRRRSFLPHLVNLFEKHHYFDAALIRDYIFPLFNMSPQQGLLRNHVREIQSKDGLPKEPKRRQHYRNQNIKYRIGEVFRHKRYDYIGVIYGWDPECKMPDEWIQRMRVLDLERGRTQPFYHILSTSTTFRYVAEDNIQLVKLESLPEMILEKAGQFFKRWDSNSGKLVSNVTDEYPDD